jgi:hypothetical protein
MAVTLYPEAEDLWRPVLRVSISRAARLYAPGGTVHVVVGCNDRMRDFAYFEFRIADLSAISYER